MGGEGTVFQPSSNGSRHPENCLILSAKNNGPAAQEMWLTDEAAGVAELAGGAQKLDSGLWKVHISYRVLMII